MAGLLEQKRMAQARIASQSVTPTHIVRQKNAIEVGEIAALPSIIDILTEAVQAGELDAQLRKLQPSVASSCARRDKTRF